MGGMSNGNTSFNASHQIHSDAELRRRLGIVYRIILANTAQTQSKQQNVVITKEQKEGDIDLRGGKRQPRRSRTP